MEGWCRGSLSIITIDCLLLDGNTALCVLESAAWNRLYSPAPAELSGHKKRGSQVSPTPTFPYYRAANAALAARRASCGLALRSTRAWIAAA